MWMVNWYEPVPEWSKLIRCKDNTFEIDWIRVYKPVSLTNVNTPVVLKLEFFPNPAQSILTIKNVDLGVDTIIELFSVSGKRVKLEKVNFSGSDIHLNISDLPSGVYQIRILSEEVRIGTFVKEEF